MLLVSKRSHSETAQPRGLCHARMLVVCSRRLPPIELVDKRQYLCRALGVTVFGDDVAKGTRAQHLPLAGEPVEVNVDVGALYLLAQSEASQIQRNGSGRLPRLRVESTDFAKGAGHPVAVAELLE